MEGITVFRFRYCFEPWQTLAYDGGILPSLKQNRMRTLLIPPFLLSQCILAIRLCRENRYDIIHAHWIIPQGLVAVLIRPFIPARPALVITSHGGDLFALKGRLLSRLKKWITGGADQLTVVSSVMKTKAVALELKDEKHICVIPMGMDSHQLFYPPPTAAQRQGLLFVGRLVEKKGIRYLLEAMPEVLKNHPEQSLTIVGDGPLKASLQAMCEELGIAQQVVFTGSIVNRDIPVHLRSAVITVFPSVVADSGDQDGTPVAIMEALACGCPTIVSDYPGARDIIHDGQNGLLVDQKSPDQLARAINHLLNNPEIRGKLGEAGRTGVQQNYDWQLISAKFLALFQTLRKPGIKPE
jgi:glycosyltransferase involved in cell wall biosynthesis